MQWNLRLAAAQRGIWRSSDLRRLLAEAAAAHLRGPVTKLTPHVLRHACVICSALAA